MFRRAALALATAVLVTSTSAAVASYPGTNGTLSYGWSQYPRAGIFTTTADGDHGYFGVGRTTSASADGSEIAVSHMGGDSSFGSPQRGIWLADRDGSNARLLTTGPPGYEDRAGALSPDASLLAFERTDDNGFDRRMMVKQTTGGPPTRLDSGPAAADWTMASLPTWTPSGDEILYVRQWLISDADPVVIHLSIQAVTPDGSGRRNVFSTDSASGLTILDLSVSPDGTKVAVHFDGSQPGQPNGIYVLPMSTTTSLATLPAPIAADGQNLEVGSPEWSPDGTRIAFMRTSRCEGCTNWATSLSTMAPNGADVQHLRYSRSALGGIDWQACPAGGCPAIDVDLNDDGVTNFDSTGHASLVQCVPDSTGMCVDKTRAVTYGKRLYAYGYFTILGDALESDCVQGRPLTIMRKPVGGDAFKPFKTLRVDEQGSYMLSARAEMSAYYRADFAPTPGCNGVRSRSLLIKVAKS